MSMAKQYEVIVTEDYIRLYVANHELIVDKKFVDSNIKDRDFKAVKALRKYLFGRKAVLNKIPKLKKNLKLIQNVEKQIERAEIILYTMYSGINEDTVKKVKFLDKYYSDYTYIRRLA